MLALVLGLVLALVPISVLALVLIQAPSAIAVLVPRYRPHYLAPRAQYLVPGI